MGNVITDHPGYALLTISIIVAGAVASAFLFVFDENKIAAYRAQVQQAKTETDQYRAKVEILETEIRQLRSANERYLQWLQSTTGSFPNLEAIVSAATDERDTLREKLRACKQETQATAPLPPSAHPYSLMGEARIGETFYDPRTGVTIGVNYIASDAEASGTITLPDGASEEYKDASPGRSWNFEYGDSQYRLTLRSADWYRNTARFSVHELDPKPARPEQQLERDTRASDTHD